MQGCKVGTDVVGEKCGLLDRGEVAPARIAARVQSVTRTRVGQMVVTLDNGQIWQQGNGEPDVRLDVGDTVTIKKAALGSYILSTPAGRSFRVRRLE